MRILVDIPEDDLTLLNELSKQRRVPRAVLARTAIASFLEPHRQAKIDDAFGLWKNAADPTAIPEDGVAYQRRLRSEWEP